MKSIRNTRSIKDIRNMKNTIMIGMWRKNKDKEGNRKQNKSRNRNPTAMKTMSLCNQEKEWKEVSMMMIENW